jgi:hypothetical protein
MSRMFQISSKERKSQRNGRKHSLRVRPNDKVGGGQVKLMPSEVIATH